MRGELRDKAWLRTARRAAVLAAAIAVILLAVGCDWTQPGFGQQHNFYNPVESGLSAGTVGSLHETFTVPLPAGASRAPDGTFNPPIVVDGELAVASFDPAGATAKVTTWDAGTGAPRWSVDLPGAATAVTDVVAGHGRLYVATLESDLSISVFALSSADGSVVWTTALPNTRSDPITGRSLCCLSLASGQLLVDHVDLSSAGPSVPVVTSIDAATGVTRWEHTDSSFGLDTAYFAAATASGKYIARDIRGAGCPGVDLEDVGVLTSAGEPAWSAGEPCLENDSIVLASGERFFGTRLTLGGDWELLARDAATGAVIWSNHSGPTLQPPPTPIAASALSVVVRSGDGLSALDVNTGNVQWHLAGGNPSSVAIAGGLLYTRAATTSMTIYDMSDGHVVATVPVAGPGQLVVANGRVYLLTGGGLGAVVHAYSPT